MSTQHTPGPWSFYTMPQPNGCPIIGAGGKMVAMLAHSVNHADQAETALANARLMSAAPEMAEALLLIESKFPSDVRNYGGMRDPDKFLISLSREEVLQLRAAIAKATIAP